MSEDIQRISNSIGLLPILDEGRKELNIEEKDIETNERTKGQKCPVGWRFAETGMFVDHYGQRPPRLSGESSSKKVAQGVIRAIKRDTVEVFVTARPTRLFLALYTLWPGLGNAFLKWVGVMDLFRRAAEKQRQIL